MFSWTRFIQGNAAAWPRVIHRSRHSPRCKCAQCDLVAATKNTINFHNRLPMFILLRQSAWIVSSSLWSCPRQPMTEGVFAGTPAARILNSAGVQTRRVAYIVEAHGAADLRVVHRRPTPASRQSSAQSNKSTAERAACGFSTGASSPRKTSSCSAKKNARYLVGTPKDKLCACEQQLLDGSWHKTNAEVQLQPCPENGETYILRGPHLFRKIAGQPISAFSCCMI